MQVETLAFASNHGREPSIGRVLASSYVKKDDDKTAVIFVRVTDANKAAWVESLRGMPQTRAGTRLVDWFMSQPQDVRTAIMYGTPVTAGVALPPVAPSTQSPEPEPKISESFAKPRPAPAAAAKASKKSR